MKFKVSCRNRTWIDAGHRSRTGMIALSEMLVVVATLAGLLWLGLLLWPIADSGSLQTGEDWHGCSERSVYRISLDSDGQRMWIYRPMEGILRLHLASGTVEQSRKIDNLDFYAMAHSADGSTSVLCTSDTAVLWTKDRPDASAILTLPRDEISVDADVSADGSIALQITSLGRVRGWRRIGTGMTEFACELPPGETVIRMGLSDSGDRMCVARSNGTIAVYEPRTGEQLTNAVRSGANSFTLTWSDDERSIVVAGSGGSLQMLDADDLNCRWQRQLLFPYSTNLPTAIAVSRDGRYVAVAFNSSSEISICPVDQSEPARQLQGHAGIVRSLQFAPDSKSLYSGSYDGTIRQWSTETGTEMRLVD